MKVEEIRRNALDTSFQIQREEVNIKTERMKGRKKERKKELMNEMRKEERTYEKENICSCSKSGY
jgi:hypothetical protein